MSILKTGTQLIKNLFKDNNDINEKSIVGFASFVIMVLFACADLITGYLGKDLVINEFIYDSFLFLTLGAFGIAEVGKVFGNKGAATTPAPEPEPEEDKKGPGISINIDNDDW